MTVDVRRDGSHEVSHDCGCESCWWMSVVTVYVRNDGSHDVNHGCDFESLEWL